MQRLVCFCIVLITFETMSESFRINPDESVDPKEINVDLDSQTLDNQRDRRAVTTNPRQNCNTWSPWINNHHPTDADPGDKEHVTKQKMDIFCPPAYGGYVNDSDIKCTDEKGEEFYGNQTGPHSEHYITCFNARIGAICEFYKSEFHHCPDLRMKYKCSCSDKFTAPVTMKATTMNQQTSSGKTSSTLAHRILRDHNGNSSSGANIGTLVDQNDGSRDTGNMFMPYWLLNILVAVILFCISICTTVTLYIRLRNQLKNPGHGPKVHPTTDDKQVAKTKFVRQNIEEIW
ncbi:hypothetical protein ACF0H5_003149 [Mactra antiquata]